MLFPISTAQHSSPAQLQHARSLARSHLKSEKLDIATALVCGIKILPSMEMASQSTFLSFKPSFTRASSLNCTFSASPATSCLAHRAAPSRATPLPQCLYLYTAHFHHVVRFTFSIKLSGYLWSRSALVTLSLHPPLTRCSFHLIEEDGATNSILEIT